MRKRRWSHAIRVVVAAALVAGSVGVVALHDRQPVEAAPSIDPVANPPIEDSCGIDVTLVLDASGSIQSSNAVDDVRNAAAAFLDSLRNTDSTARVTQFATFSEDLAPPTLVTDAALEQTGALGRALSDYYNPKPPRPGGSTIFRYDGSGSTGSNSNWDERNGDNQYTNWDQSLDRAGETPAELVLYVTDGEPTAYDLNGDTADPDPPKADPADVGTNTNRGDADDVMLDRSIQEANEIKSAGTRMLAVGVGSATGSPGLQDRLELIAGPQLVRDSDLGAIDSLNDIDVAIVSDFDDLAQFLRGVVLELCSPSLTITKRAQSPSDGAYQPAPGWSIEVEPTVPPAGDSFEWILPDTVGPPPTTKTAVTNANGSAAFQWEPDDTVDSVARVRETVLPGWNQGRPGAPDYACEARDEFGAVRELSGELVNGEFVIDPIGQEVVTCTLWNSFEYAPGIELVKVNAPTQVRGDLSPPAVVTSTFTVSNTGNADLTNVVLADDRCDAPPVLVAGDTGADGRLPAGLLPDGSPNPAAEVWSYTCTRAFSVPDGPTPDSVVNNALVTANDPVGTAVNDTASDDVDVYTAAVDIVKTAAPTEVPRGQPATITYTYTVTNPASLELAGVVVADGPASGVFNAACAPVTFVSGDTDADGRLDPGETWTYTCTSDPTAPPFLDPQGPLRNRAVVTGDPVFPDLTPAPPAVTDGDTAVVTVFDGQIELVKTVGLAPVTGPATCSGTDAITVLPGTAVSYCYTVTNPGTSALRLPAQVPGPYSPAGWVTDTIGPDTCAPVTYVPGGDANADGLLQPTETWLYTCTATVTDDALNTAEVSAETDTAIPVTVSDTDQARVDVVEAAIEIEKIAVRPVVLDPAAPAIAGPDVPLRAPAVFLFEVSNPGDLPIQDVSVTDTYPVQGGNSCDPSPELAPGGDNVGDVDGDGLLDPGEVWEYLCVHDGGTGQGRAPRLTKADADTGANPLLPAPVTDTATASGTPLLGGLPTPSIQSAPVTQQVLVIDPSISIEKSASADVVLSGDDVTYTFEVVNTGDVGLINVTVDDDRCGPVTFASGDVGGDGVLGGGTAPETWVYTCTRSLDALGVDTNTARVFGNGPLGNLYTATDTAQVRVIDPAIDLVKTVSESLVPVGTEVAYEFLVTNAGTNPVPADDVLAEIVLADASAPAQPSCASPSFVDGDSANPGFLDRGETWRYECTAVIDQPTTNVAGVTGVGGTGPSFPDPLPVRVFDFDVAFVQTFDPGIQVVKSVVSPQPPQLAAGGPVEYRYEVTNTGDVPLAEVTDRIVDDRCSPVAYVDGDLDGDGLLDTPNSIFEDAADETWVFSCTTTIVETTTNTVDVIGTPTDPGGVPLCGAAAGPARVLEPCDVTATDDETVVVYEPATIVIRKETDPATSTQRFEFSSASLFPSPFTVAGGESETFTDLAPGTYVVTETAAARWELASLSCDDTSGTTVDLANRTASIDLESGERVTCTFVNELRGALPGTELPSTGSSSPGRILALATLSLLLGLASLGLGRRRLTPG